MDQQDTFQESVSTILERKVRGWLSGVIEDMRRSSPVQQWLDSLPPEAESEPEKPVEENIPEAPKRSQDSKLEDAKNVACDEADSHVVAEEKSLDVPKNCDMWKRKSLESGDLTPSPKSQSAKKKLLRDHSVQSEGYSPKMKNPLLRDCSLQSDASGSSGSSVLNVLGARKVDAEAVLLALGFGPSEKQQKLQRIPDRFLRPSKLKGISTEQFIKDEQHSMRMHECGVFGYRGLTGNPHVPPSTIVAKIMDCILKDDVCREQALIKARHSVADIRSAMQAQASKVHHMPRLQDT